MASTYIEYAKGGSDFRAKGTISCWVKRSSLGVQQEIWSWGENNSSDCYLRFDTADNIEMHCDGGGSTVNTTSLHRDVNGWYHFVFSIDGQNSTANLRRRFWINGVQVDEGLSSLASFSAAVFGWHSTQDLWIGARARSQQDGTTEYFDGLMSHFHYCSNYSYAASDFGSFDSTTGEWKINDSPNVQYGSEGFFLKMEDSSNMDLDSSGNNKTLTTSGTLTATKDCPSNVFCTINPLSNKIAFNLANGNTTLNDNGSDDNDNGIAATMGVNSGKYYWEMKKGSGSGGVHAVITDDVDVRLGNRATSSPDSQLWGFQSNGTGAPLVSYIAGTFDSSGNALQGWGANDIIGFALDMDNGKLYVSINGTFKGLDNNTSDPANGTNPAITGIPTGGKFIIPYFEKRSADSPETMCNFGNGYFGTTAVSSNSGNGYSASGSLGIFQYQPPSGYTALCTKGLNQ